jgi:hypothetical protein
VVYRGALLSGIPNWMMAVGYTKSSWTLKISLLGKSLIELLRYMDTHGYDTVAPYAAEGVGSRSILDLDAGYMQRAKRTLPRQGDAMPWQMRNVFLEDRKMYRGSIIDDNLRFSSRLERELAVGGTQSETRRAEISQAASGRVAS